MPTPSLMPSPMPSPVPVRRVVTVPVWDEREQADGELLLRMNLGTDAASAWGFGGHPTSSLCLSLLLGLYQGRGPRPRRVLDVGCGAGLLSIVAERLGAEEILGIDVDAAAPALAAENAARNGAVRCRFATTPLGEVEGLHDLVLANLWSAALVAENARLLAARARGGHVVTSGFKSHEADGVAAVFAAEGLRTLTAAEREDNDGRAWGALLLRDGAGPGGRRG
jgi:ribosomal protein L11 methyltransferase